ncbi:restriction endonuclease subunit S [Flavobacterium sp.]|uniref:restriction endonuclease subunit S n=1 Tax=Flavobacterium sp. TaxID=239 RepID=UPI0037539632
MIKYNKYKPSEIDWLGDIPNDWEVKRVKDLAKTKSGTTPHSQTVKYYSEGIHNWVRTTDLNDGELFEVEYKITDIALEECNMSFLPIDTILVAMYGGFGTIGKNSILKKASTINQSVCAVLPSNKLHPEYFLYFLKFFRSSWRIFADGTRKDPNINQDAVKNLFIYFPKVEEQKKIVHFINTKTQAIDKKINLLTQKANYYKEYRKSLINGAVCKGLDKYVKSKVTELGFNVNENYSFFRLKDLGYLYSGLSGKSGEDFNQDENPNNKRFIPFTNIANNTYLKKDHLGTVVVYDNENQNKVKKEDVFFLMSSEGYEDIGKSAILDYELNETYLNSFCKGYRVTNRKANPYFLNYLLLSDNYRKQLTVEGKGFTRINLKMEKVNDFIVFIPNTIDEQKKIVSFLDDKTQTIDKIVSNINAQIATLKELRKTLINDAVTGKIKVS